MRTEYTYQAEETTWTVSLERRADQLLVTVAGRVYELKLLPSEPGLLYFQLDGRQIRAYVAQAGSRRYVAIDGESWKLERVTAGADAPIFRALSVGAYPTVGTPATQAPQAARTTQARSRRTGSGSAATSGALVAEMPGQVLELLVKPGDSVTAGQTLVLLEAMKMELRVTAPAAGQIRQVYCTQGQVVERGQTLVEFERMKDE